jgi:hypothetical protein
VADRRKPREIPEFRNRDGTESGWESQAFASIWGKASGLYVSTHSRFNVVKSMLDTENHHRVTRKILARPIFAQLRLTFARRYIARLDR